MPIYADTTTTINFDPPNYSAGNFITNAQGAIFSTGAEVFSPTRTSTQSSPNALRSTQDCTPGNCPEGATRMSMMFPQRVNFVSLRAGTEGPFEGCFPENADCNLYARLVGYDSNGNPVADSRDVLVLFAGEDSKPITTEVSISDSFSRIQSATIFFGKGTFDPNHEGFPERVQIDDLAFTVPSAQIPSAVPPEPTITITSPVQGQSVKVTDTLYLKGSISAPGSLFAFCSSLNSPLAPPADQCSQTRSVDANGQFSVWFDGAQLSPGQNSLYAFAYDLHGQLAMAKVDVNTEKPAAPTIVFTFPRPSERTDYNPPTIIFGDADADGGFSAFCTRQNDPAIPSVDQCTQLNELDNAGGFQIPVDISNLRQGINTWYAYVYDRWGTIGTARLELMLPVDIRITGMEVTQGIQKEDIPINTAGSMAYHGVKLILGGKTVVRVFANVAGEGEISIKGVSAILYGTVPHPSGGEKVLGVVFPSNGARDLLPGNLEVTSAERADANGSFVFTLPSEWTKNSEITLIARLIHTRYYDNSLECAACKDNSFTVTNVRFERRDPIIISPVEIIWTNSTSGETIRPSDPAIVFARTAAISPLGEGQLIVRPYAGTIDVTDLVNQGKPIEEVRGEILNRIAGVETRDLPGYTIGVSRGLNSGLEAPYIFGWPPSIRPGSIFGGPTAPLLGTFIRFEPIAFVDEGPYNPSDPSNMTGSRSLSIVTHEFYHQLAYYHAGLNCSLLDKAAIRWPPDDHGRIQGIGLNRLPGSGRILGTYAIMAPGEAGQPNEWVDLMSYCISYTEWFGNNNDYNTWISVRNWEAFGGALPNGAIPDSVFLGRIGGGSAPAENPPMIPSVPSSEPMLRVTAISNETGFVRILTVEKGVGGQIATEYPDSLYKLVARNRNGDMISNTNIPSTVSHIHVGDEHYMIIGLSTEIPVKDAQKLEILYNNTIVAQRIRSANAPQLTLLEPSPGQHITNTDKIAIKWLTSDLDGDTLETKIEYSADNGKTYRVISTGVKGNEASFSTRLLSNSDQARIRITVNDGFNENVAISKRFIVEGITPIVRIIEPSQRLQVPNSVPLHLVGQAFDDKGRLITNSSLTWFADGKALGTGSIIDAPMLIPGIHEIKLQAIDDNGLSNNATSLVEVISLDPPSGETRLLTLISVHEGNSYIINGSSTSVQATSFRIQPQESIEIPLVGNGEIELILPKTIIDGILKVSTENSDLHFEIINGTSSTAIRFVVPENTQSIRIFGTNVIP